MKITLVASTRLADEWFEFNKEWAETVDSTASEPEILLEAAGRACYQSWNRPNPKTRSNRDYIAHILQVSHESILEHASATFYIEDVSRSLTHELVRHRHLSFSQLSQRFVDESKSSFVLPPAVTGMERLAMADAHLYAQKTYTVLVGRFLEKGLTRKQAREAARAVLPNATETKIVVTGNYRAWRHFIKVRGSAGADAEIRLLALEILRKLKEIAPNSFQDLDITKEGDMSIVTATHG